MKKTVPAQHTHNYAHVCRGKRLLSMHQSQRFLCLCFAFSGPPAASPAPPQDGGISGLGSQVRQDFAEPQVFAVSSLSNQLLLRCLLKCSLQDRTELNITCFRTITSATSYALCMPLLLCCHLKCCLPGLSSCRQLLLLRYQPQ